MDVSRVATVFMRPPEYCIPTDATRADAIRRAAQCCARGHAGPQHRDHQAGESVCVTFNPTLTDRADICLQNPIERGLPVHARLQYTRPPTMP
jgi:hypothetical protein